MGLWGRGRGRSGHENDNRLPCAATFKAPGLSTSVDGEVKTDWIVMGQFLSYQSNIGSVCTQSNNKKLE
jgi:hypothetical protein